MDGFISVIATQLGKIKKDSYGNVSIEKGCAHNVTTYFLKFGIDKENDVYVDSHLGAVVDNVDVSIENIDDLEKFKDKKTGINPYQRFLYMRDKGYLLVVGEPFVGQHGGANPKHRGIYCKNYLEIVKQEKALKEKRKKRSINKFSKFEDDTINTL